MISIASMLLSGCGRSLNSNSNVSSSNESSEEVVVRSVSVTPINGGINPVYRAIDIKGTVSLGSNECFAAGISASFEQTVINGKIYVVAIRTFPQGYENRYCPMDYNPVSKEISTSVLWNSNEISDVVIKHYNARNVEVSAIELIKFEQICTTDINQYGHSSACTCPGSLSYHSESGLCF